MVITIIIIFIGSSRSLQAALGAAPISLLSRLPLVYEHSFIPPPLFGYSILVVGLEVVFAFDFFFRNSKERIKCVSFLGE